MATDARLDRIEFADPPQGFFGDRRADRLVQLVELTSRMCPAGGQDDIAADSQPLKAGIAIHLQNAAEALQMRSRSLALAVGTVEVDGGRRVGSVPASLLPRIDPQPPRLGPSPARIEHRNRRVVGEDLCRGEDVGSQPLMQGFEPPAGPADPVGEG